MRFRGRGRRVGDADAAAGGAAEVTLEPDTFTLALDGAPPMRAAYRELATVAIQSGTALLVIGDETSGLRVMLDQLGDRAGPLVSELRHRRLRQRLGDRLVELPDDPFALVEYEAGDDRGVTHLAFHPWGAVLAPLDERREWRIVRRAAIERVTADPGAGSLAVALASGATLRLIGLGAAVERERLRWQGLRDGAYADASAILTTLVPDLPFATRDAAATRLRDGSPASASDVPDAWPELEAAVLAEPAYADTYRALRERGGPDGGAWLALAPERPGAPERARAWFFVALPGNLVAMELVTKGAHATYCFRVAPRATYGGERPAQQSGAAAAAVSEISEALVDARFLREPMALPEDQLSDPRHLRYRFALRELPSLRAARARFVARLVHRDAAGWAAALDDLIGWHGAARHDAASWPGRAAQERAVDEAGDRDSADPTAAMSHAAGGDH